MQKIGSTLRDTRMRRRIDISDVETATKIRAKYLRALENEEWDLLPGPAFVKSFMNTYCDYLDIDSRTLVQAYRFRYEKPALADQASLSSGLGSGRERTRLRRRIPPLLILVICVVILLAALFAFGYGHRADASQLGDLIAWHLTSPEAVPIGWA